MVTDEQVKLMRQKRMEGKSQDAAAAAAGMSVRTARTWAKGSLPSSSKGPREWRTRPDPLAKVWESDVVPLLEADEKGILQATVVLEELQERCPKKVSDRPDLAGSRAGIGLLHDPELVLRREPSPPGLLDQFGIGPCIPDLAPSGRYALLAYGSLRSAAAGPIHLHR